MKFRLQTSTLLALGFITFFSTQLAAQSVGINLTGSLPISTNMLEVLQTNTVNNTISIYAGHTGAVAGSGYALQAIKTGASITNIAAYLSATGGTSNYALLVPSGEGNVGIGNTSPTNLFTVGSGSPFQINPSGAIAAAAGILSSGVIQFSSMTTDGIVRTTLGNGTLSSAGGNIDLTSEVTGILPLANGGTNANLTAVNGGVVYSTGSAFAVSPAGTAGQVLTSTGSGAPTWAASTSAYSIKDFKTAINTSNTFYNNSTLYQNLISVTVHVTAISDQIIVHTNGYIYQSTNNDACFDFNVSNSTDAIVSETIKSGVNGDGTSADFGGMNLAGTFVLSASSVGTKTIVFRGGLCSSRPNNFVVNPRITVMVLGN